MVTLCIVEVKIIFQPAARFIDFGISCYKNVLVFHGPPQPLHEDVVEASTATVHAVLNVARKNVIVKLWSSELGTLIDIEVFRGCDHESFDQCLGAKIDRECRT